MLTNNQRIYLVIFSIIIIIILIYINSNKIELFYSEDIISNYLKNLINKQTKLSNYQQIMNAQATRIAELSDKVSNLISSNV